MKVCLDYPKRKNSLYEDLLADYKKRISEFAKISETLGKSECLTLCFVVRSQKRRSERGRTENVEIARVSNMKNRILQESEDAKGAEDALNLSSEELAELIQTRMSNGVSNIRVCVRIGETVYERVGADDGESVGAATREPAGETAVGCGGEAGRDACGRSDDPCSVIRLSAVNGNISEELAEVLAAEQLYRAFMIQHNRKYHK